MSKNFYVKYRGKITEATLEDIKAKVSSGEIGKLHKISADKQNWEYASYHVQTGFKDLEPAAQTASASDSPTPSSAPPTQPPAPPTQPPAEPTQPLRNRQQCPSCLCKIIIPEPNSGRIRCPRCDKIARVQKDGSLQKSEAESSEEPTNAFEDRGALPSDKKRKGDRATTLRWIAFSAACLLLLGGSLGVAYMLSPPPPNVDPDSLADNGAVDDDDESGADSDDDSEAEGEDPATEESEQDSNSDPDGATDSGENAASQPGPRGGDNATEVTVAKNTDNPSVGAAEGESKQEKPVDPDAGRAETLTNSVGMTLKLVRAGKFVAGSPITEEPRRDDEAQRRVTIAKSFYLAAHEVTNAQFIEFVKAEGFVTAAEKDEHGGEGINQSGQPESGLGFNWRELGQIDPFATTPVVNLTRADAEAFCKWLSQEEDATYRLPTEEEWEFACRAGTKTKFYNGDNDQDLVKIANVADQSFAKIAGNTAKVKGDDGFDRLAPVGRLQANALGLFDMLGNVAEWCAGEVDSELPIRGGSWDSGTEDCRSAARSFDLDHVRYIDVGFRVLREVQ